MHSKPYDPEKHRYCCCPVTQSCLNLCNPMNHSSQAPLSFTLSQSLLKLMSIESVMPSTISSSVARFSSCLQSFPASESFPMSQLFPNKCALHIKRPKFGSFTFSISPSNEYSGLISFRIDWFDLFAVQGTVKRLLQHHSSEASILQHSTFFMVQLSHLYMTTGKTIALTRWTFVSKVYETSAVIILKDPRELPCLFCQMTTQQEDGHL